MGKFIALFKKVSDYETIKDNLIRPNVSYILENDDVYYSPKQKAKRNDIITYEAKNKLTEAQQNYENGLHVNAFNTPIKSHTFENGVGTIEFNTDVTSIMNFAFYGCGEMTAIEIPNSVSVINSYAFKDCGFEEIDIPNSVVTLDNNAFGHCNSLTGVTIGSGVINFGDAFQECFNITYLKVDSNAALHQTRWFNAPLEEVVIGNNVTTIEGNTFNGQKNLSSVTIGSGVTTIGNGAFDGCSSLTSITIPNSVTSIGDNAFRECGLTGITTPDSVTTIGNGAFIHCDLGEIYIGSGITSIGNNAFSDNNNCQKITIIATTPPVLNGGAFDNTNWSMIYVPGGTENTYRSAQGWQNYQGRIQGIWS